MTEIIGIERHRILQIFRVDIALVNGEQEVEQGMDIIFAAESEAEAVKAGIRWAQNRLLVMRENMLHRPLLCVGCIKVRHFVIVKPKPDGYIPSSNCEPFFEWKYDTASTTLDELLAA